VSEGLEGEGELLLGIKPGKEEGEGRFVGKGDEGERRI
jgi:hypothetical protein